VQSNCDTDNLRSLDQYHWWDYPDAVLAANDEGPYDVNKWIFGLFNGTLTLLVDDPVNGPVAIGQAPFTPDLNTWYHVALTRQGTTFTAYVNGAPIGTDTSSAVIPNANAPLTMGQAEGIGWLNGLVDEMTIYHRALSGSEIAAIYSAGGAGKCKSDVDNDGLPDWWELQNFGTLIWSGTNVDSNGNTLLDDYTYNVTPANVIQFTIEVANNYVNTVDAPAQISLESGFPYSLAISVDDTNFAADAVWTPYTSANIIVPLGATEGWHDVWIGLRRYGDDPSAAVWVWKRLKLDTTPPALVITGPTNGTVNVPLIQLTGYSPEALGSISYDLTNALGLVTNQQVLVLDQAYSTNTWEFTTNTFQAFDVPLTNGVNTITLRAADLAGNVSTLTTNITVDYTDKPAPVVQLYWPQDGTLILQQPLHLARARGRFHRAIDCPGRGRQRQYEHCERAGGTRRRLVGGRSALERGRERIDLDSH
jgi:Concanavalin A-like lectin/glucanases superfamily